MPDIVQTSAPQFQPQQSAPQLFPKVGFRVDPDPKREQAKEEPLYQKISGFTDKDVDVILKKAGIELNPYNRQLARYLLRHHIQLERDIFIVFKKLFPIKIPTGVQSEALIAAASKLPFEKLELGYRLFLSILNDSHPEIWTSVKQIISILSDIISETYNVKNLGFETELLREAFAEKIDEWKATIRVGTDEQIRLLVGREELLAKLHRTRRFVSNLLVILSKICAPEEHEKLRSLFVKAIEACRLATEPLLADAILSREDIHRHLTEQGASHNMPVQIDEKMISCRLWAHDRYNPSAKNLDSNNLVLFFRWKTKEFGVLEARVVVLGDDLDLIFATSHEPVRTIMDEAHVRIEERLIALGFNAVQMPTMGTKKITNDEIQIEHQVQKSMHHLDAKA